MNNGNMNNPDENTSAPKKPAVRSQDGSSSAEPRRKYNIIPKIFSLIAAIILWFYVMAVDSPDFTRPFSGIQVQLYGLSELESTYGLSALFGDSSTIDVTLSGKKNMINNLSEDDIYTYVDVSGIKEAGTYALEVGISVPSGVTVISSAPQKINVRLDINTTKAVPVTWTVTDMSLDAGYSRGTITTNVDYVTVTGPQTELDQIKSAQLNLSLGKMTGSMTVTESFVLIDNSGAQISSPFVRMSPSVATANVPLLFTKDISLNVAYKHGYFNKSNCALTVSPETISVRMPAELASSIGDLVITTIDETTIAGDTTLQSNILLPSGVENLSGTTTADIGLTLKNVETNNFRIFGIIPENIPDGFTATIETSSVAFTVRGPLMSVNYMSPSDFKVTIDLSTYTSAGSFSVPVTVTPARNDVYVLNTAASPSPSVIVRLDPAGVTP